MTESPDPEAGAPAALAIPSRDCQVCELACTKQGVLSDGSVYHVSCYESLVSLKEELSGPGPQEQEQARERLRRDLAVLRRKEAKSQRLVRRAKRFFNSSTGVKLIAEIEDTAERLQARTLEAAEARHSFDQRRVTQLPRVQALLESLYDRWPTYPPDWSTRAALIRNPGNTCSECEGPDGFHVHHRIPISRGGTHRPTNLTAICEPCHAKAHGGRKFGSHNWRSGPESGSFFGDRVAILEAAIADEACVRFSYVNFDKQASTRTFRPASFLTMGRNDSLIVKGYCYKRLEERAFRVSRMRAVRRVSCPP